MYMLNKKNFDLDLARSFFNLAIDHNLINSKEVRPSMVAYEICDLIDHIDELLQKNIDLLKDHFINFYDEV